MSFGRTRQESSQELLKEATDWLVGAVGQMCTLLAYSPQTQSNPIGFRAQINDRIERETGYRPIPERQTGELSVNAPMKLNHLLINQNAINYLRSRVSAVSVDGSSADRLADAICYGWRAHRAAKLSRAWLQGDYTQLKGFYMQREDIEVLIGAAAAAAVLALVLMARRNPSVQALGRTILVSKDFLALQNVRDKNGVAADIARRIIDDASSPWDFALEPAVGRRSTSDKRTLLSALAQLDMGVEVISPEPGAPFDPEKMKSARVVADGSRWVVAASPTEARKGFWLRGKTEVFAEVDVCTADWWCVALADENCPIAAAVKADPERYVSAEAEYASCWTIAQGFSTFADLRTSFDEGTLSSWSQRLRDSFSQWYPVASSRRPVVLGNAGDRYDASVMRSVNGSPEADARVVAVEERDGIPQNGLGCIGAPPLLYAVVRVEEE